MTRLSRTAIAAGTAALATAAVLATTGSAQAPAGTSLHLVSKQTKGGFMPKRFTEGARFGFVDKVSGDDTGSTRIVCTDVGNRALCTIQVQLSKGTLSAQGIVPQRSNNSPIAITGGTGAYNGARGTVFATDTSRTTSKIDVELLP
jgi:hypothetical protein